VNIGELARRTGLSVKTIRYYSDEGLVPEASRSPSGYRRYDAAALARLEFVRTLRDLGLDLATIRRVLDHRADLRAVAVAHADALAAQIRLLRVQRAAVRALAGTAGTAADVERMNRIAQATAEERRRAVAGFLDSIFDLGDGPVDNDFTKMMRGVTPELPDDPSEAQLDAWLELAELMRDAAFRDRLRTMSQWMRTANGSGRNGAGAGGQHPSTPPRTRPIDGPMPTDPGPARELAELVAARAGAALDAGVRPDEPAAAAVVAELVAAYAGAAGRPNTPEYRRELVAAVRTGYEPRAERYWQLMAVINGWPERPSQLPAWAWFLAALEA
jgi:DNA-binding transcriptional MerR regulator